MTGGLDTIDVSWQSVADVWQGFFSDSLLPCIFQLINKSQSTVEKHKNQTLCLPFIVSGYFSMLVCSSGGWLLTERKNPCLKVDVSRCCDGIS